MLSKALLHFWMEKQIQVLLCLEYHVFHQLGSDCKSWFKFALYQQHNCSLMGAETLLVAKTLQVQLSVKQNLFTFFSSISGYVGLISVSIRKCYPFIWWIFTLCWGFSNGKTSVWESYWGSICGKYAQKSFSSWKHGSRGGFSWDLLFIWSAFMSLRVLFGLLCTVILWLDLL